MQIFSLQKSSPSDKGKVIQNLLPIYNLICISFSSYLKNLRHHRLNSEPEKLRSFLERIENIISISMDRKLISEENFVEFIDKIQNVYLKLDNLAEIRELYRTRHHQIANGIVKRKKDRLGMYRSNAERKSKCDPKKVF